MILQFFDCKRSIHKESLAIQTTRLSKSNFAIHSRVFIHNILLLMFALAGIEIIPSSRVMRKFFRTGFHSSPSSFPSFADVQLIVLFSNWNHSFKKSTITLDVDDESASGASRELETFSLLIMSISHYFKWRSCCSKFTH